MCGISGYCGYNLPEERLRSSLALLAHRGPDDEGLWHDEMVGLGHKRLSISDLSANGRHPMVSEDGAVKLAANGEIYNFIEIRELLKRKGHHFASGSDSEVLLHGYEEWGADDLLRRINGMFAFAIHDAARNQMVLARDRLGVKPLYFWRGAGKLAFASEIQALPPSSPAPSRSTRRPRTPSSPSATSPADSPSIKTARNSCRAIS